jgi:hypothetical protein
VSADVRRHWILVGTVAIVVVAILTAAAMITTNFGDQIDKLKAQTDRLEANQVTGKTSRLEFQNNITKTLCFRIKQVGAVNAEVAKLCAVVYQ